MKKTFTVTTVIQAAYILVMAAAILLIALRHDAFSHDHQDFWFDFGTKLFTFFAIFPVMPVCLSVNTVVFCARRKITELKQRRVCLSLLILSPIIVTVAWMASIYLLVAITGGV